MVNTETDEDGTDVSTGASGRHGGPPEWLDRDMYPFDSNHVNLDAGRLHYVDEGEGRPVARVDERQAPLGEV